MATASGLSLVAAGERDAARATSEGTGDVLRAVLDAGIRDISLGIGGSATTDGGAGLLRALGATRGGRPRRRSTSTGLDPRLAETRLRIACDVTNPLLGERGAAATYGPQKGATPDDVPVLDARLARFADALDAATGRSERHTPGRGRRGRRRVRAARLADRFASLTLEPGIDLVMAVTGFEDALASADLVITGEGRIDAQTAFGKTALGVAQRAQAAGNAVHRGRRWRDARGDRGAGAVGASPSRSRRRPNRSRTAMAAGVGPARALRRAHRELADRWR